MTDTTSAAEKQEQRQETARMLISLIFNVVSSVGVIFINKRLVFNDAKFRFATALTIIHFGVCFLGCLGFSRAGFFEWKAIPLSKVLGISVAFCGYVAFNNMSLLTNSVAIYQISKILTTPVLIVLEYVMRGQTQSRETLLSLLPTCAGIIITVYTDTEVNAVGLFWAALAVVANSFYTMWGNTKQKELEATPMQLLSYQAPMSAVILVLLMPIFEPMHELLEYHYTGRSVAFIGLSCVFAFCVNFSFFLSVGKTSPLTINVLGYVKTCLVFIGGFLFFNTAPTWQNITGISMTMLGFALYTKSKMPSSAPAVAAPQAHAVEKATAPPTGINSSDHHTADEKS